MTGVGAALVSDWFVDALDPAVEALGISKAFTGLVIVAIAGNAVENVVGITLAAKGQTDLAISVVKNSVAQIAVFLFPALVLLSLFFDQRLTFVLDPVYIGALAMMALAVWQITGDGEAALFEGLALVALYVILAALTCSNEGEPLRRGELAPLALSGPVHSETGVAAAVEPADAVTDRVAHPPHLAVAALVQDELDARSAEPPDPRGRRRPSSSSTPSRERAQRVVGRLPRRPDHVHLLDAVPRMREPVR